MIMIIGRHGGRPIAPRNGFLWNWIRRFGVAFGSLIDEGFELIFYTAGFFSSAC